MAAVRVSGVSKRFGAEVALDQIEFAAADGSFTVICGPSKCGKSVLFRLLVGLETADAGVIELEGEDITHAQPGQRRIGYVPQSFALYPNLSVRDNIAYPLTLAKTPAAEIEQQVERACTMLSITHLLGKTPDQLSGGEKQRTALARGLLKNAKVFVLDDPLVGLDYKLRERLMDDLKELRSELGATFVYATSDSIEALRLASDLVVLDLHGKVQQQCDPVTAYRHPANARVMELLGFPRANLLSGTVAAGKIQAGPLTFALTANGASEVRVGFRPEALKLTTPTAGGATARVHLVEDLGSEMVVYVDAAGQALTSVIAADANVPQLGEEIGINVAESDVHLFGLHDGAKIS